MFPSNPTPPRVLLGVLLGALVSPASGQTAAPAGTPPAVSGGAPLAMANPVPPPAPPGPAVDPAHPTQPATPSLATVEAILDTPTRVVELSTLSALEDLIPRLADRRVVFVGEAHDRYEDHLNQLMVIRGLHGLGLDLAIGMEMFQQPFQEALDAYVAGEIDEAEMLRRTGYFERWRFDYRLYRPILRYAREHRIPLIALNLEREITEKVGQAGLGALDETQRARIPTQMDREDPVYRERLKRVFDLHPQDKDRDFENFLSVQLLWDEGMAERAADYLRQHPGKTMVILAGQGHIEFGQGIPRRLQRRLAVPAVSLLNGSQRDLEVGGADYLLFPRRVDLPITGRLGVMLDTEAKGPGVAVQGFSEPSGAAAAGMKAGDRIVRLGGQGIAEYTDIRVALMDSRPGEKLAVEVERGALLGSPERLTLEVELH